VVVLGPHLCFQETAIATRLHEGCPRPEALPRSLALAEMKWLGHAGEIRSKPTTYSGYHFPVEVIQHATSLYRCSA
jgi:hypothetical protein